MIVYVRQEECSLDHNLEVYKSVEINGSYHCRSPKHWLFFDAGRHRSLHEDYLGVIHIAWI